MELDRASQFAGILAWEELMKVTKAQHGLNTDVNLERPWT